LKPFAQKKVHFMMGKCIFSKMEQEKLNIFTQAQNRKNDALA